MSGSTDWRTARLGDCCEIVSGSTPRRDHPPFWAGTIAWATPRDISALDSPILKDTAEKVTGAGYASCATTLMPVGAVLFSSRAPVGLVAIAGIPVCTNQGFKSFVPGPGLDSGFLYWWLRRHGHQIAARGSGSTFTEVSKEVVSRVRISFPPLAEQRRIAAMLDKADAVRRKRRESLRLLDEFLSSAFLEMFGDPVRNPRKWTIATVAELVPETRPVTYGIVQAGPDVEDGVPYIRSGDITHGRIDIAALPRTSHEIAKRYDRSRVAPGDVVFSIRASVGAAAAVPAGLDGANLTQGTARIAPGPSVTSEYLLAAIRSTGFQQWIRQQVKGVTFSEITLERLRLAPMMVPPPSLQRQFRDVTTAAEALRQRLEAASGTEDGLFRSLEQRAFVC